MKGYAANHKRDPSAVVPQAHLDLAIQRFTTIGSEGNVAAALAPPLPRSCTSYIIRQPSGVRIKANSKVVVNPTPFEFVPRPLPELDYLEVSTLNIPPDKQAMLLPYATSDESPYYSNEYARIAQDVITRLVLPEKHNLPSVGAIDLKYASLTFFLVTTSMRKCVDQTSIMLAYRGQVTQAFCIRKSLNVKTSLGPSFFIHSMGQATSYLPLFAATDPLFLKNILLPTVNSAYLNTNTPSIKSLLDPYLSCVSYAHSPELQSSYDPILLQSSLSQAKRDIGWSVLRATVESLNVKFESVFKLVGSDRGTYLSLFTDTYPFHCYVAYFQFTFFRLIRFLGIPYHNIDWVYVGSALSLIPFGTVSYTDDVAFPPLSSEDSDYPTRLKNLVFKEPLAYFTSLNPQGLKARGYIDFKTFHKPVPSPKTGLPIRGFTCESPIDQETHFIDTILPQFGKPNIDIVCSVVPFQCIPTLVDKVGEQWYFAPLIAPAPLSLSVSFIAIRSATKTQSGLLRSALFRYAINMTNLRIGATLCDRLHFTLFPFLMFKHWVNALNDINGFYWAHYPGLLDAMAIARGTTTSDYAPFIRKRSEGGRSHDLTATLQSFPEFYVGTTYGAVPLTDLKFTDEQRAELGIYLSV